jgi:hypothetical protein
LQLKASVSINRAPQINLLHTSRSLLINMRLVVFAPIVALLSVFALAQSDQNTTYLTATALVTRDNASAFECWQLTEPFKRSSVPGVSGTLVATIGNYTNLGYTILPPRFDGGLHTAPVPQYVMLANGETRLTFIDWYILCLASRTSPSLGTTQAVLSLWAAKGGCSSRRTRLEWDISQDIRRTTLR